jgi:hypothetical protein
LTSGRPLQAHRNHRSASSSGWDSTNSPARRRPKLLVWLTKFGEPVDSTLLQFADEHHPLYQQQRERLERALRNAWQRGRDVVSVVNNYDHLSSQGLSKF